MASLVAVGAVIGGVSEVAVSVEIKITIKFKKKTYQQSKRCI